MPTLIIVDFFLEIMYRFLKKVSSCPLPYFPKLEHSPVFTGIFSPVSLIFHSVTGEINFITPEGCGCDKGKFGLLHNTQDFLGGI